MKLRCDGVRIGISGWRYPGWRGTFYPQGLPQRCELEFAAKNFNSIEINGTHYSLQRPEYFDRWAGETPDNFVFAIKGSRFITHMKKLRDIEEAMANFFAQGILRLGTKLGPVLWQFAPQFNFDASNMEAFFALLPRTMEEAAHVAEAHGSRLRGRAYTKVEHRILRRPIRHCVEIRSESFAVPNFIQQLRKDNVGLVIADTVEWPLLMDLTADFVYCRLHGSEKLYASGYGDTELDSWAERVAMWATGEELRNGRFASKSACKKHTTRDVYVYFDNDMKVRAPFDATALAARVSKRLRLG